MIVKINCMDIRIRIRMNFCKVSGASWWTSNVTGDISAAPHLHSTGLLTLGTAAALGLTRPMCQVSGWPLHDIAITNIVRHVLQQRMVGEKH